MLENFFSAPKILGQPLIYDPKIHNANGFQSRHIDQNVEKLFAKTEGTRNDNPMTDPVTFVMLDNKRRIRAYINFHLEATSNPKQSRMFCNVIAVDMRYTKCGYPEKLMNAARRYCAMHLERSGMKLSGVRILTYGRLLGYFARMGFQAEETNAQLKHTVRPENGEDIKPIQWTPAANMQQTVAGLSGDDRPTALPFVAGLKGAQEKATRAKADLDNGLSDCFRVLSDHKVAMESLSARTNESWYSVAPALLQMQNALETGNVNQVKKAMTTLNEFMGVVSKRNKARFGSQMHTLLAYAENEHVALQNTLYAKLPALVRSARGWISSESHVLHLTSQLNFQPQDQESSATAPASQPKRTAGFAAAKPSPSGAVLV